MKTPFRLLTLLALLIAAPHVLAEDTRTANRSVVGDHIYPAWLLERPEHYEFLPDTSNHDPLHQHSMQWQGQDWAPENWHERWTPEIAIRKFYEAGIFARQYRRKRGGGHLLVLDLGPTFFKISELDQQRTLKLLTDTEGVFDAGYPVVELRDAYSGRIVGSYTPTGLQLN